MNRLSLPREDCTIRAKCHPERGEGSALSPPLECQLFMPALVAVHPPFTLFSAHVIFIVVLPEWRNWQTQQTQNLPGITPRVGSTPSSGTKKSSVSLGLSRVGR